MKKLYFITIFIAIISISWILIPINFKENRNFVSSILQSSYYGALGIASLTLESKKMVTFLQLLGADGTIFKIYNYEPYFPSENIKSDLPGISSFTDDKDPNIIYTFLSPYHSNMSFSGLGDFLLNTDFYDRDLQNSRILMNARDEQLIWLLLTKVKINFDPLFRDSFRPLSEGYIPYYKAVMAAGAPVSNNDMLYHFAIKSYLFGVDLNDKIEENKKFIMYLYKNGFEFYYGDDKLKVYKMMEQNEEVN